MAIDSNKDSLHQLRENIDQIDEKILQLLSLRGETVQKVGKYKQKNRVHFHIPEREKKIFQKLKKLNKGPYPAESIQTIFREIISASVALESLVKVAYLGPETTFTHQAALKQFGQSAQFFPKSTISNIFEEVDLERVQYGVVPIENSTEGFVNQTLDLLVEFSIKICGEVKLQIAQNLLSKEKNIKKIKKVYSHPQALAQCRVWLSQNLGEVELIDTFSTTQAAERVASEAGSAAISSKYAAAIYGLNILQEHIEDYPNNRTRFVVVGKQDCEPSGEDKTSLVFSIKDEIGALHKILAPLAREKINLTKIESRPLKGKLWEYIFFVDLDGHRHSPKVSRVLEGMSRHCSFMKILGSYPNCS